jgi:pimeloyl-ACP methyl ester carboxylesterase
VVVVLIYLYGDVLRICSGDLAKSKADKNFNQSVWLGIAVLMLTPILMVFLTLVLPQPASRWANIIEAAFFFLFNLVGLPTYPSLTSRDYTLIEKVNMWRGKSQSGVGPFWDEMIATDLTIKVPELEIPVYFFGGIYDYTCSYTEAKSYFEILRAPLKGFYTFEQSAHSPLFEEPEKMLRILLEDVLAGANSLANVK